MIIKIREYAGWLVYCLGLFLLGAFIAHGVPGFKAMMVVLEHGAKREDSPFKTHGQN